MNTIFTLFVSFIFAFILTIIPLPTWALWYRPAWVPLVLIYCLLASPGRMGLGSAWVIGLLLDAITGSSLGEHALGMVLIAFLAIKLQRQMQMAAIWQQSISILLLIFIFQLTIMLSQGMLGQANSFHGFWIPAVTSMFIWPWLVIIMRDNYQTIPSTR